MKVYNSAGEVVKVIFQGGTNQPIHDVTLSTDVVMGDIAPLKLDFDSWLQGNIKTLTWNGDNDSGQGISSGAYHIAFSSTDTFGKTTSFIRPVTVLNPVHQSRLDIFNSAGERVTSLDLSGFPSQIVSFEMKTKVVSPVLNPSAGPGDNPVMPGSGLVLSLRDARGKIWDYEWPVTNNLNQSVASGSYTVQLYSIDPSSGRQISMNHGIQVLHNGSLLAGANALAAPNPAQNRLSVFISGGADLTGIALLYNLAGELVAEPQKLYNYRTDFDVSRLASGVYVVIVEHYRGEAKIGRTPIKVVVAH